MSKYEEQFQEETQQTLGCTNEYIDWLEQLLEKADYKIASQDSLIHGAYELIIIYQKSLKAAEDKLKLYKDTLDKNCGIKSK